jgi:hypothetical protein
MAAKKTPLVIETLKHDDATRKNIPTAEYQSSSTWECRILRHGKNSIHRTAGYVIRSSGTVEGRGREISSGPD